MRRAGQDANGVTDRHCKARLTQGHASCTRGNVINLFCQQMPMRQGFRPRRHTSLSQTLRLIAMHYRVQQFADFRPILGLVGLYF